ncbi:GNAT family N-acetyltransferase [Streptomyces gobiensis]|uniref:GNAT family N-acetyltransferase n=1 Tax=Streptomyces gobiensis TaxID=2875706 RepID=UPI001E36EE95|nr:GNAT family N-acetyltransferase [Streptomyces gobiensis]UGY91859.1 GNAT family N-acetyltransferase [Streptomyces gobiensis]
MFDLDMETDDSRRKLIEERLEDTNLRLSPVMSALSGTPADDEEPVHIYASDTSGELAGGLVGYAWGHWLHIDLLWVDKRHRGSGLGTRLMARAEEIAREKHGCAHARVETWARERSEPKRHFQAPDFYQKLGYRIVGIVENYPPGCTDHLLVKTLS